MLNSEELSGLLKDGVVMDESGDKVGKVGQIYLDDESGNAEWVTAKTGLFGTSETFIPVRDAKSSGSEVRVPYGKDQIKDAPQMDDAEGHLSPDQEQELYRYYGLASDDSTNTTGRSGNDRSRDGGDHDGVGGDGRSTSKPDGDGSMVRSEEQLRVGTEKVNTGKAKLRKFVVTENVTKTVPVEREELRLEREPITDANRDEARKDADFGEGEQAVTLSEERVVVDKETVPVERVALDTETVTDHQEVSEEVRKEEIDTDLPNGQSDRR